MSDVRGTVGAALLHVPHPLRHPREGSGTGVNPTAVLITSCVTLVLIAVNTTAINTALNAIADDLSLTSGELSWGVGAYMLAVAAAVVLGGRLGDMLGERIVIVAGLALFAVSALVVAAATSGEMLIAGRVFQGLGAAALMPGTMAVLRIAYPPERQGFALGIWGATAGIGFGFGPLIGGVVTDTLGWRWIWWGTLALASALIVASLVNYRGMPRPEGRPRFDIPGIVLLPAGIFPLILAIQQGPEWGWGSPATLAAFAASAVFIAALVAVESRAANPMLHLRLLRLPALLAANVGTFANTVFLIGMLFFFNLYAQSVFTLDYSAVLASVALLAYGVPVVAASLVAGRICDRLGFRWPVAAGLVLMGIAGLLLSRVDATSGYGDLWWPAVLLGVGVGMTFSTPSAAGLSRIPGEQAGEASGIINVVRYVCAALIVAIGTVVFTSVGSDELNRSLDRAGVPRVEQERLDKTLTGAPAQVEATERTLDPADRSVFRAGGAEGVANGFARVMLGSGLVALLAAPLWIVLLRPPRAPPGSP